jgi:hypothetical protein
MIDQIGHADLGGAHDKARPVLLPCKHMASDSRVLHTYLGAGARPPHHVNLMLVFGYAETRPQVSTQAYRQIKIMRHIKWMDLG